VHHHTPCDQHPHKVKHQFHANAANTHGVKQWSHFVRQHSNACLSWGVLATWHRTQPCQGHPICMHNHTHTCAALAGTMLDAATPRKYAKESSTHLNCLVCDSTAMTHGEAARKGPAMSPSPCVQTPQPLNQVQQTSAGHGALQQHGFAARSLAQSNPQQHLMTPASMHG
jgi:hypothetical protein